MLRAAERGHEVLFVETGHFLGRHLWTLVRRGSRGSLLRRLSGGESVAPRIRLSKALNILPWRQRYSLANRIDAGLTAWAVRRAARSLPRPVVLWVYDPTAARTIGSCGEAFAVYDCVDDYAAPVADAREKQLVLEADARAARRARLVFTTTKGLEARHRRNNGATFLIRNAGDYEMFVHARDRSLAGSDVAGLPCPILGFVGNLISLKVDFDLLEAVARARPSWTLVLVGPAGADARSALARLTELPNVCSFGLRPLEELPSYVAAFDVGLIPYRSNEYTRNCFPLKVYEYLAAGKPVVAAGLPELLGMEPDVVVAEDRNEFIESVEAALSTSGDADVARRQRLAGENSWEQRTERLLSVVAHELDRAARDRRSATSLDKTPDPLQA
jgi:glycosyltransferase involved in cell wall biosynthesis